MRAVFVIIFVFTIVFTWVVPPSVDTTQRAEFIELTSTTNRRTRTTHRRGRDNMPST